MKKKLQRLSQSFSLSCGKDILQHSWLDVNKPDLLTKHCCITRVLCNKVCYKLSRQGGI